MGLEEALQEHEERVETLLKSANRYVSALKTWKKSCQTGHLGNLQKSAAQAEELIVALPGTTSETRGAWAFDARSYLAGNAWLEELMDAADRLGLRVVVTEEETLASSPVTVKPQPARGILQLGKMNWPTIRPRFVAAELKKLRDKTSAANSQDFLESLYGATTYLTKGVKGGDQFAKFRDIYNLFCLTPGYKKENPPAVFGQQIYALHRSELRTTRNNRTFGVEIPSGAHKPGDVFTVTAEDGRSIRYYGIWFK